MKKFHKIIKNITKEINISFGSIDIIKTDNKEYLIMEINSGVMMDNFIIQHEDGELIAKKIYKRAIEKMFNN